MILALVHKIQNCLCEPGLTLRGNRVRVSVRGHHGGQMTLHEYDVIRVSRKYGIGGAHIITSAMDEP